jgi:DNA-binding Xre family transcriptional regulator
VKCSRRKCGRTLHRKGLCHAHYDAYRKTKPAGRIDIQPVRDHLELLFGAGMTYDRVSKLAGVSRRSSIKRAFDPDRKFILAHTAAKLLAVPVPAFPTPSRELSRWIPSIGTTRRLQSLIAIGYRQVDLQDRLGVSQQTMSSVVNGREKGVRTDFAQNVDALFRELQLNPRGDVKSVRRAVRRGWVPPMAWENIDDPAETPDGGVGSVSFIDSYDDARGIGRSDEVIAAGLGIKVSSLLRRLERQWVA